jgi:hypothetical protein
MQRARARLTYANVVSTLALFLVLSGGAAFAAKKLTTSDIKKGAIKTKLIAKNAVTKAKIAKNAVNGTKVKDGSLTPADLAGGASVVADATGGPLDVGASPTSVPLSGGSWTQKPKENDLIMFQLDATLAATAGSSCSLTVSLEIGGTPAGSAFAFTSSAQPTQVITQSANGARLASGSAQSNQLKATASAFGIINPCTSVRINSLKVKVIGVG